MKTYILSLFSIIGTLFIGCQKEQKCQLHEEGFTYINAKNIHEAELDFTLYDTIFFNNIKRKAKIDLCQDFEFNGITNLNGCKIKTPLKIRGHDCFGKPFCSKGEITCIVDERDNIFINDELPRLRNIDDIEFIKQKCWEKHKIQDYALFIFSWQKGIPKKIVSKRFIDMYKGISLFYNELSLKLYQKEIEKCSEKQRRTLISKFRIIVDILPYEFMWKVPPPPPPSTGNYNSLFENHIESEEEIN